MKKVLIVTGGSRGIGAATCQLAATRGFAVAVNYRSDQAAADRVVAAIVAAGGEAVAIRADVAREAEVEPLFDTAAARLGPVTHLVNNAGMTGPPGRFADVSSETLRQVFDLNVLGAFHCARTAVRRLSKSRGGPGGVIVNVSSVAAALGSPHLWVWYAASKAAIDAFTYGLGQEVAGDGIRVAAVAPGITLTDLVAANVGDRLPEIEKSIPIGRTATPQEIAESILFLLSEASSFTTGAVLRVAGGR
jgi:NAD(P)-dependent dehydrogenase (short-subunit alcohol dehydrogenase family)